jgi:DNA repair protein RadC
MVDENFCKMVYEEIKNKYHVKSEEIKIFISEDVLQIKHIADISGKKQEYFSVITLDTGLRVIKCRNITKGLLNHSLVHPREVFRDAILDSAMSIVCVHNHPSGSLVPSDADIKITEQLKKSGEIIGIELLDHVIVAKNGISSMRGNGYF